MSALPWIFERCRVTNVVDGDTCDVEIDLGFLVATRVRVRLLGIDTPERGQPGWAEATERLRELAMGRTCRLVSFKPNDKYGRFLAVLHVDGENINQSLVASGHAREYMP